MNHLGNIASVIGFSLALVGTILFWLIDWILGLTFTIFVIAVLIWYIRTKRSGDLYLKRVAKLMDCDFEKGRFGYGRVSGVYRGHKIEVRVNKDYDGMRGISGFLISSALMSSAVGAVAGIKNFTSIKIKHDSKVSEIIKLDSRTFIDEKTILYLPPSKIDGLPISSEEILVRKIDDLIRKVKKI